MPIRIYDGHTFTSLGQTAMTELRLHKKVLAWGNSYGIRLTKKELEQLARVGDEVEVVLRPRKRKIDWSKIGFSGLPPDFSERADEYAYEAWLAEQEKPEAGSTIASTRPRTPQRGPAKRRPASRVKG